jgi:hypothetical protein
MIDLPSHAFKFSLDTIYDKDASLSFYIFNKKTTYLYAWPVIWRIRCIFLCRKILHYLGTDRMKESGTLRNEHTVQLDSTVRIAILINNDNNNGLSIYTPLMHYLHTLLLFDTKILRAS